ncbi:MAG: AAA+ family ATPase [Rhodobacteraceae bacterium]|nr:AAA+ family ATPase [Paracoccaceae bacterium]
MRRLALVLALLLAAPVAADEPLPGAPPEAAPDTRGDPGAGSDAEQGFSLIEEGAKLLFRGLIDEMEPAMKEMAESFGTFAREAEPMLRELARLMGNVGEYHAPEVLPNGDILIRKRQPGEPPGPGAPGPQFGPGGETEL